MQAIINTITQAQKIALVCHADPDGDAIGALLALGLGLEKLGKDVTMLCPSSVSNVYHFLHGVQQINACPNLVWGNVNLGIVLDCSSLARLGRLRTNFESLSILANIDHHNTNDGFGDLVYTNVAACSTAEIVYHLLKALNITIDKNIATAIYVGIVADTGSFRFANTTAAAFAISAEMIAIGVQPFDVAEGLFGDYRIGRLKLLNSTLDSLEISPNGRISIMTVTKDMLRETGTQPEDAKGLISYALHVKGVELAALITEEGPSLYHVSLRAGGDVNVAEIAKKYGGGGHVNAAGFQIQTTLGKLKDALWKIL